MLWYHGTMVLLLLCLHMDALTRSSAMGNHGQGPARKERSGTLRNSAQERVIFFWKRGFRMPTFKDTYAQMSTIVWFCVLFWITQQLWINDLSQWNVAVEILLQGVAGHHLSVLQIWGDMYSYVQLSQIVFLCACVIWVVWAEAVKSLQTSCVSIEMKFGCDEPTISIGEFNLPSIWVPSPCFPTLVGVQAATKRDFPNEVSWNLNVTWLCILQPSFDFGFHATLW